MPVAADGQWHPLDLALDIDLTSEEARTGTLRLQEVNEASLPVFFDLLSINHPIDQALVCQENHYYPFGMALSGIASKRVLLSVYTVAGLIYGIAAWVLIGRAGAATPNAISDGNLQSITAVVIGGTSLFGGRGGVVGTLLGALIVQAFTVGLALAGVDQQFRLLAIGILVIAAVSVDQWIRKVKG